MISFKDQYDTSGELQLKRFRGGIKLMRPDFSAVQTAGRSVSDIFNLPLYFYFVNTENVVMNMSETTALTCGWESVNDARGSTLRKVADRKTAELLFAQDRAVVTKKQMHIIEEPYSRLDGIDFVTTGIKFPWYNTNNEVIGVFGCSIMTGDKSTLSLAESLTLLIGTELLNQSEYNTQSAIDKTYGLTLRQSECLHHYVRGMTAKQISRILALSPRTVEHYLEMIKVKMNCRTRSEIIEKYLSGK